MTSDGTRYGSANRLFDRAIANGDLERAVSASRELPQVPLANAVKILFLMGKNDDKRYAKAAARWMSRYASETKELTPGMLADVADALAALEHGDWDAAERLLTAARKVS